jgi:hypothetical protein
MRQTISGLLAAFAVVTVSAAPAMACGGGLLTSSCSPCQSYVSPCAQSGYSSGYGYGYGYGVAEYQRLPDPTQYYYVNQGPVYSGPGNFAPVPTYQERAVSGWSGYGRGEYGYHGGRYANATTHYYHGAPAWRGPATYSYRPRTHFRPYGHHHGYGMHRMHHGYGMHGMMHQSMRYGMRHAAPRYSHAPRGYGHHQPLRRYY